MSMKSSNGTIGNRTRDLPSSSAVPQPTAPPRGLQKILRRISRAWDWCGPSRSGSECSGTFNFDTPAIAVHNGCLRLFVEPVSKYELSRLKSLTVCDQCETRVSWRQQCSANICGPPTIAVPHNNGNIAAEGFFKRMPARTALIYSVFGFYADSI